MFRQGSVLELKVLSNKMPFKDFFILSISVKSNNFDTDNIFSVNIIDDF